MELLRALATLSEPPTEAHARVATALGLSPSPDAATYTELFVLSLPPYASIYVGEEGMLGGEARDRVAGFLRALDVTPPADPDHLALLLGLAAHLADGEADAGSAPARTRLGHARQALLWEHVASWLPIYLDAVARQAPAPYEAWARLLDEALRAELAEAGPPPAELPLQLRSAPPLADPRDEGGQGLVAGLLAPARTGFIITRADLQHLARTRGLGLRIGERAFVLRALLGQDAHGVLAHLGALAGEAAERWSRLDHLGATGAFWHARAKRSAALLDELADDASRDLLPASDGGR